MSNTIDFDERTAKAVEAMYLTPDVVAQRAEVIKALAPKPGEHLLDIGAGPGLLAYDLARLAGENGRVLGIDTSEPMVKMARTRCAALPQAEFEVGDAVKLAGVEGAFDAAVSTQVYEYVADMDGALKALHRVLRPGGRALILDTDWDSIVWHASDRRLMQRVLHCWDDHLADPHLPATLAVKLRRAGFTLMRMDVVPMTSLGYQPHSYAAGMMHGILGFVRANGERHGLSADEIQTWYDDQLHLAERGEFFFSLNRYMFFAVKPV